MAREIESNLYRELIISEFSFMGRGIRTIDEIYETVKKCYPELCDDAYLCSQNCRSGNDQPEWNHTVRNAINRLKSLDGPVRYTGNRGLWLFS